MSEVRIATMPATQVFSAPGRTTRVETSIFTASRLMGSERSVAPVFGIQSGSKESQPFGENVKVEKSKPQRFLEKPRNLDAYVDQKEITNEKLVDQIRQRLAIQPTHANDIGQTPVETTTEVAIPSISTETTANDQVVTTEGLKDAALPLAMLNKKEQQKQSRENAAIGNKMVNEKPALVVDKKELEKRLKRLHRAIVRIFSGVGEKSKAPLFKIFEAIDPLENDATLQPSSTAESKLQTGFATNVLVDRDEAKEMGTRAILAKPPMRIADEESSNKKKVGRWEKARIKSIQHKIGEKLGPLIPRR